MDDAFQSFIMNPASPCCNVSNVGSSWGTTNGASQRTGTQVVTQHTERALHAPLPALRSSPSQGTSQPASQHSPRPSEQQATAGLHLEALRNRNQLSTRGGAVHATSSLRRCRAGKTQPPHWIVVPMRPLWSPHQCRRRQHHHLPWYPVRRHQMQHSTWFVPRHCRHLHLQPLPLRQTHSGHDVLHSPCPCSCLHTTRRQSPWRRHPGHSPTRPRCPTHLGHHQCQWQMMIRHLCGHPVPGGDHHLPSCCWHQSHGPAHLRHLRLLHLRLFGMRRLTLEKATGPIGHCTEHLGDAQHHDMANAHTTTNEGKPHDMERTHFNNPSFSSSDMRSSKCCCIVNKGSRPAPSTPSSSSPLTACGSTPPLFAIMRSVLRMTAHCFFRNWPSAVSGSSTREGCPALRFPCVVVFAAVALSDSDEVFAVAPPVAPASAPAPALTPAPAPSVVLLASASATASSCDNTISAACSRSSDVTNALSPPSSSRAKMSARRSSLLCGVGGKSGGEPHEQLHRHRQARVRDQATPPTPQTGSLVHCQDFGTAL